MIDTKRLRLYASVSTRSEDGLPDINFEDWETLRGLLADAADEIDAGRNARLVQYRCALIANPKWAGFFAAAENDAHAMLAAERPVKP